MTWKPNTKYRSGDLLLKVNKDGTETCTLESKDIFYKVGAIQSVKHWNTDVFVEVKTKVNHLPEWL